MENSQTAVTATNRQIAVDWMYDVCHDVTDDESVFLRAVYILDRYEGRLFNKKSKSSGEKTNFFSQQRMLTSKLNLFL